MGDRLHVNLISITKIAKMTSRDEEGKINKTLAQNWKHLDIHKVLSLSSHRSILG